MDFVYPWVKVSELNLVELLSCYICVRLVVNSRGLTGPCGPAGSGGLDGPSGSSGLGGPTGSSGLGGPSGSGGLADQQGLAEILIQLVHWRADEVEPLNSLRRAGF